MRLCFPQYFESKSRFLSYTVVASAFQKAGHEIVADMDGCDAVLFSMCDVVEYRDLMKMRERSKGHLLIVGGAFAFNFWSAILYSDAVWVGEVYDMADCKTVDEIMNSQYCYTGGDKLPKSSTRIDWEQVPIAQIKPTTCYYWGGVGCKNKCTFCYTSWTHKHQTNAPERIRAAIREAKRRKKFIMISSNEYENDPESKTFDMLLRDYVKTPVYGKTIRCGVEFATEESRKRNGGAGKQITKNDIYHALQKAAVERCSLKLFHITGYDTIQDWETYINDMCRMLDTIKDEKLLVLGFNNLQYQNYTPLYAKRKSINPENYISIEDTKRWYDRLRMHTKSVLVQAPSRFQHVCCRMGVELARDKKQVDFWASMMIDPVKKLTVDAAYKALFDSGIMDTPALKFNPNTEEITISEAWT